jgi:hypothetical protein
MSKFARPWLAIDALGKLKISKSSYIFVIVVPILSRIFHQVESPLKLSVAGEEFTLAIAFPVTWYTFYFGALFIALGSAIYSLWCPSIIRLYPNYGIFLATGRDDNYIRNCAVQYLNEHDAETLIGYLDKEKPVSTEFSSYPLGVGTQQQPLETSTEKVNPAYGINRQNTFNELLNRVNDYYPIARFFATILYYLGLLAFIGIIALNASIVLGPLIKSAFYWLIGGGD